MVQGAWSKVQEVTDAQALVGTVLMADITMAMWVGTVLMVDITMAMWVGTVLMPDITAE